MREQLAEQVVEALGRLLTAKQTMEATYDAAITKSTETLQILPAGLVLPKDKPVPSMTLVCDDVSALLIKTLDGFLAEWEQGTISAMKDNTNASAEGSSSVELLVDLSAFAIESLLKELRALLLRQAEAYVKQAAKEIGLQLHKAMCTAQDEIAKIADEIVVKQKKIAETMAEDTASDIQEQLELLRAAMAKAKSKAGMVTGDEARDIIEAAKTKANAAKKTKTAEAKRKAAAAKEAKRSEKKSHNLQKKKLKAAIAEDYVKVGRFQADIEALQTYSVTASSAASGAASELSTTVADETSTSTEVDDSAALIPDSSEKVTSIMQRGLTQILKNLRVDLNSKLESKVAGRFLGLSSKLFSEAASGEKQLGQLEAKAQRFEEQLREKLPEDK